MKRLFGSLLVLPLLFAACTDDNSNKDHQKSAHPDKQTTTQKDKDKAKDKEKDTNQTDKNQSDDNAKSGEQPNTNTNQDATNNAQSTVPGGQGTPSNSNGTTSGQSSYVAPYQGQNVVPVAQNLVGQQVDRQEALSKLPNFKGSLDRAQAEANSLNQQNNPYNDYALQGNNGQYTYMFSFINASEPGTYIVVTVDGWGQAKIVDPHYHQ
ncbi:hypothetical protein [Staphylococcus lutrae]|uniref:Lipoprotein n=1 Tax=Staphylococcus lutrae TaxID=155085 RepID=A0AAC9WIR0_9STAP|nr:hypothetical protein [Staphylococcus lutrae]ARJ50519.1 hypothetical protein B5P37_03930 [Staphylococcus lutrae]PNZ37421.1 hypothetical protein CD134_06485 [Staphylococcus lutrae]